ncbi:MAG: HlyD family efflux transporter periplasmic adaptor subunit [Ekhidna sp.]
MPKQLFPKEFINSSLEHYTFRIGKRSSAIYLILLTSLLVTLVLLPLIQVPVSTYSRGLITTQSERFQLMAPKSGIILSHELIENKLVNLGDTILRLDQSMIDAEISQLNTRIDQLNSFISDLGYLINGSFDAVSSKRYRLDYSQFETSLDRLHLREEALLTIYKRQEKLFDQQVIAQVDYEKAKTDYDQVIAEITFFRKQASNNWKQASINFIEERNRLFLQQNQLKRDLERYVLIAPCKGELQNVTPLGIGQLIVTGAKLAEITPDTTLFAVCYLPPQNIGFIRPGMRGEFRIDAFNYNDWGKVKGTISNISSDAYIIKGQSVFRVECILDRDHLFLKNDFRGQFKKGMTLQASFEVSNRTLYELLYDKIDDWINPNRISN